ncbi:hypothetical protein DFA_11586 [Cavenderia fasciculata]|uniref:F-box domain-containing protein n=1 Tax=Cavenderia fasciculata TaxID=261658 RepID=F4QDM8_CACFS|nr:uncharacterized protein DFA_11586 [Cavenderia fasciculata]EGG13825.1 hypothetical protein DFA_11586 [Cavenderia fasciculata]|eukprot:XP_004350533.1 hypothetical protein DFA_11586 [Cavenderia fasciculata]
MHLYILSSIIKEYYKLEENDLKNERIFIRNGKLIDEAREQYQLTKQILNVAMVCKQWFKLVQSHITTYSTYFGDLTVRLTKDKASREKCYQGVKNQWAKEYSLFSRDNITTLICKHTEEYNTEEHLLDLIRHTTNLESMILYTTNNQLVHKIIQQFPHIKDIEIRMGVVELDRNGLDGLVQLSSPNIKSVSVSIHRSDERENSDLETYQGILEKYARYWCISSISHCLNTNCRIGKLYLKQLPKPTIERFFGMFQHIVLPEETELNEITTIINSNAQLQTIYIKIKFGRLFDYKSIGNKSEVCKVTELAKQYWPDLCNSIAVHQCIKMLILACDYIADEQSEEIALPFSKMMVENKKVITTFSVLPYPVYLGTT